MVEPPMLDGAVKCIIPPVLIGVTTKLVGSFGTCAWAAPKQIINNKKIKYGSKLTLKNSMSVRIRCMHNPIF
jgi:hypothetical protein